MVTTELEDFSINDNPENQTMPIQDVVPANEDKPSIHTAPTLKTEGGTDPMSKTAGGADPMSKTHAKAADYDAGTRSIIQTAIGIYCTTLLCNDPYAQPVKELEWARAAWDKACHHHQVIIPHNTAVLKLVSGSSSCIMVGLWQR